MSDKRRGLGRGLGALIPSSASANASGNGAAPSRPVDLFFPEARKKASDAEALLDVNDAAQATVPESAPVRADESSDLTVDTTESDAATAEVEVDVAASAGSTGSKEAPARKAAVPKSKSAAAKPAAADAGEQLAFESTSEQDDERAVELVEVPGVRFAEIPVTDIHPNRKQPRSVFDEDDMAELVHSVREIGVLQPITGRGPGNDPRDCPRYHR
jgi:ParB family transcriptional regulator, chromosome partitioning protein